MIDAVIIPRSLPLPRDHLELDLNDELHVSVRSAEYKSCSRYLQLQAAR